MHVTQIHRAILLRAFIPALLAVACTGSLAHATPPAPQVLFVCEHGNVKSLMAASYFNKLAQERGVPFRAVSRGSAPDSTTIPPLIAANLQKEGFDVASFHPAIATASDVRAAVRVILIGTSLPPAAQLAGLIPERWDNIPAASTHYAASSSALRAHVEKLIDQLAP